MKSLTTAKKSVSLLLSMLILISVFTALPLTANAFDSTLKICGDFEYRALDDSTAIITGYNGSTTELEIPETLDGYMVASIGEGAFMVCKNLRSITIPDSVTTIGRGAFSGCSSLSSVKITNSITSIANRMFYNCTSLNDIIIPDNVESIDVCAFEYCKGLERITIPDKVTSIENSAFYGCEKLTDVTIGNSVKEIGRSAFDWCTSLKSITIPSSVTSIGEYALGVCSHCFYDNESIFIYDAIWYYTKVEDFTIVGYNGTEAEKYANNHGLKFTGLDEAPATEPAKTTITLKKLLKQFM